MNRRPIIALDMDGVLCDVQEKIDRAWKEAGLRIDRNDVTDFDYRVCVGPEAHEIAMAVFRTPTLYDDMDLVPGAAVALARLRGAARVIAVTAPFVEHLESKWRFLLRAGFDHKDIVVTSAKTLVRADLLLDDNADTLVQFPGASLVFHQPWNARFLSHYPRVKTWDEVPDRVLGGWWLDG